MIPISPTLHAGAAQIDITPKTDMGMGMGMGIHLAGAVGEFRPAQEVLDPLYARALVLRNGQKKICFVSLDLTIITEDWTAKIREAVAAECEMAKEAIMVHVTQTHSAPSLGHFMFDESFQQTPKDKEWLRGGDSRYFDFAFERIIQAIRQADNSLQPVRIRAGSGIEGRLAFNRRAVSNDGRVRMPGKKWPGPLGPTYIRYLEGPIDPELGVMCFQSPERSQESSSGQMLAMLLHYTCHPVNVFPKPLVSADWPGAWASAMQKTFGQHCVPMVLNGCCGNINPWNPFDPDYVPDHCRLAELADKHGLKFFIQLMCDGSPYWFEQKYPDASYLNSAGQRLEFQARGSMSIGGAPGPCFHNPTARKYAEEFMRRTAEHYLNLNNLYGYDLWNEIWMAECFCEHTQAQFRSFLKQKYGNIKTLNSVWQRSYSDFEEVFLPKRGVYADMFDKYEFEQWSRQQLMQWRYDTVRSVDKKRPLVSHYLGHCSLFVPDHDPWLVAQAVDAWGTSSYDMDIGAAALTFHATQCASEGKPWWLSEQTGGRTWSGSGDNLRTNEFLKSFNVMAMAFGAEASIYWQWRPEIFGQESPHFGLTNIGGEPTERTERLKKFTSMLKKHHKLFEDMEFESPQIGILWEPRTIMYEQQSRGARDSGNWLWWENFVGWHRALLDKGYNAQILHAPTLASKGVPKNIRLLLAPMQLINRSGLTPALSAWLKSGGILVAGPWYGMYDEHSYTLESKYQYLKFGTHKEAHLYVRWNDQANNYYFRTIGRTNVGGAGSGWSIEWLRKAGGADNEGDITDDKKILGDIKENQLIGLRGQIKDQTLTVEFFNGKEWLPAGEVKYPGTFKSGGIGVARSNAQAAWQYLKVNGAGIPADAVPVEALNKLATTWGKFKSR